MMDAELSVRLAWYFNYLVYATDTDFDVKQEQFLMTEAAEEAGTFHNLPQDMQIRVLEAERSYSKEEFPFLGAPRK